MGAEACVAIRSHFCASATCAAATRIPYVRECPVSRLRMRASSRGVGLSIRMTIACRSGVV